MKPKSKKKILALPAVLTACLLLCLVVGGSFFKKYLDQQIFEERTTQLAELTSQVRVNLGNALDSHRNYLTAAVNTLALQTFDTEKDVVLYIHDLEQLLETDRYDSALMLLDSQGNCYDTDGKHGVWSDIDIISGGETQYAFISDSFVQEGCYWAFVRKLDAPLVTREDGVSFTHAVLLKDILSVTQYYNSSSYSSQNETYILKSNGTRMHDDISGKNTIQSYNVLKVLEEMDGQRCPDILAFLAETGMLCTNFYIDGEEYYYCVASLEEYDTLLLFLIPARFVASGTVNMVGMVIRTLLLLVVILLLLLALAAAAFVRQHNSSLLIRQEQANLRRQEEMNARLEESNAMLARSKETAEQAFQIAEEANKAKSSFLSNMSHDIRTPMNAIVGFAALLTRDAENPEKVRAYTRKITASSQHLLGLINDILDISKIEAGKTTLSLSEENMTDLIENIDGIIRPQMKEKGHHFEIQTRDIKHEYVVMDKLRLNQILLNLLSNAVKYTPDGGRVTLTVQELPQNNRQLACFRFIVADNGYGMTKEYMKNLFLAFTREEDSVTNKIQGTGLGMAITKNLLDLMGGTIAVDSEKGKGSTFTVELNLQINEQKDAAVSGGSENGAGGSNGGGSQTAAAGGGDGNGSQAAVGGNGNGSQAAAGGNGGGSQAAAGGGNGSGSQTAVAGGNGGGSQAAAAGGNGGGSQDGTAGSGSMRDGAVSGGAQQPEEAEDGNVLEGMHILVAEDNEINAEILAELLDMEGATCDIRENGQLAVETFGKSVPGQYQLILMDVQMPVMNGYEATRTIRNLEHPLAKTIPIIAMTANAFAEDVRDALESGMNAHVAKPVDMTVLIETVKSVMKKQ